MRYAALILGLLLLAASVGGAVFGKGLDNLEPVNFVIFGLSLLLVVLGAKAAKGDARQGDPLERWLQVNRTQILEEGLDYQGFRITRDTVLVRYLVVFSLILVTSKQLSRFYVVGKDRTGWLATGYFFGTAIAGWWGIPWGPIFTVIALGRNLIGGYRTTVGDFLGYAPAVVAAPPPATVSR